MTRIDDILHAAAGIDDPAIDQAMAGALATAQSPVAGQLATLLLQRGNPQARLALILYHHRLLTDTQKAIVEAANDLFRPLREACSAPGDQGSLNAIHIIGQSQTTRLAYLIAERLKHGSASVRAAAGQCLLEMTCHCVETLPLNSQAIADLIAALHDGVRLFDHHRQTTVLLAFCTLLPRDMKPILDVLADPNAPAAGAMRQMLAQSDHPAVRCATLALLPIPTLTQSALAGLRHAAKVGQLGQALTHHAMLATARSRHALARVNDPQSLWPSDTHLDNLTAEHQRSLIALLRALPLDDTTRLSRLETLAQSSDASVRMGVLRTLLNLSFDVPPAQIHEQIASFITDAEEPIARLAVRHLLHADEENLPKRIALLVNSPHPWVRQLAGHKIGPIAFERFWNQWPNLDASRRLAAGRALIKIDADFHRLLADRLLVDRLSGRLKALSIIFTLNQGTFFEAALIQLTRHHDPKIASSAVKTLGTATSSKAYRILQDTLDHHDARVRANTVEALARFDTHLHTDRLADMAEHDENRPRANAIAAMMDLQPHQAMDALTRMLHDAKPRHRTSALWLVETLGLIQTAGHIAEMSISDPDHAVKDRADRVIQELLSLMTSPAPNAPPTGDYQTLVYE